MAVIRSIIVNNFKAELRKRKTKAKTYKVTTYWRDSAADIWLEGETLQTANFTTASNYFAKLLFDYALVDTKPQWDYYNPKAI